MTEPESHDKDEPPASESHTTADDRTHEIKTDSKTNQEAVSSETDEFGLPIKPVRKADGVGQSEEVEGEADQFYDVEEGNSNNSVEHVKEEEKETANESHETPKKVVAEHHDLGETPRSPPAPQQTSSTEKAPPDPPSPEGNTGESERSPVDRRKSDSVNFSIKKPSRKSGGGVSEWSHQRLAPKEDSDDENDEEEDWQNMPALAEYDIYDDNGKLVAKGTPLEDEEQAVYGGLGGAGKGYTRVQVDEDAQSATSMDDDTRYLFKDPGTNVADEDDEQRDALSQLEATKDLLNEGQKIAYVGVARLTMFQMVKELEDIEGTKNSKKEIKAAAEDMKKWGQQMMVRLYSHMSINIDEQLMIEQLAEHGVQPSDLVHPLMRNARVKNPMAVEKGSSRPPSLSKKQNGDGEKSRRSLSLNSAEPSDTPPPPPYSETADNGVPVLTPIEMPTTENIELDLRWTALCDLFLLLIADSVYDARSRLLLERVGAALDVHWLQICRFEKRVVDALEMQEESAKEKWNEDDHMEKRRKAALRRRWVVMGLATAGGGLVIGLSAGLLAPFIGAGLAAGFTTVGITGTSTFLAGAGGAVIITSGAAATGGFIGVRASHRRTGAVKTFEYRPLHNNKRSNLIVTVSGWMSSALDDVRLPYSTVDPIMGDLYSIHWEPEMLQSTGQTINILATEALTQGLQQVLGSTILITLMASLQLPIVLSKLAYLIDNPWTVSLGRANSAGLILADSLIDRHLGKRPITLLGFSLGSRMIFSCLKELAERRAYGIVQNVYLFGSPIVVKKDEYLKVRSIISGRFINGYASNDWILGYLFRATSGGIMRVAGLAPVEDIPGLENINVTELVNGHMAYRAAMPRLMREVGWEVTSDEFAEIDPDPENHAARQRELIKELDDARKEAEAKSGKRRFGFFKRGKPTGKKGWETYEKNPMSSDGTRRSSMESFGGPNGNVLFDIEAIRRELHSEQIDVTELESTLPPMQIRSDKDGEVEIDVTELESTLPPMQIRSDKDGEVEELEIRELVSTLPPMKLNVSAQPQPNGAPSPWSNLRQIQSSEAVMHTETRAEAEAIPSLTNGNHVNSSGPSRQEYDYDYDIAAKEVKPESPIQMSFEPTFNQPASSLRPPSSTDPISQQPFDTNRPPSFTDPIPQTDFTHRPELRSRATEPAPISLEHNAWADEEDEFGGGGEPKMTFA